MCAILALNTPGGYKPNIGPNSRGRVQIMELIRAHGRGGHQSHPALPKKQLRNYASFWSSAALQFLHRRYHKLSLTTTTTTPPPPPTTTTTTPSSFFCFFWGQRFLCCSCIRGKPMAFWFCAEYPDHVWRRPEEEDDVLWTVGLEMQVMKECER